MYLGIKYNKIYSLFEIVQQKLYRENMKSTPLLNPADECRGVQYASLFTFL